MEGNLSFHSLSMKQRGSDQVDKKKVTSITLNNPCLEAPWEKMNMHKDLTAL